MDAEIIRLGCFRKRQNMAREVADASALTGDLRKRNRKNFGDQPVGDSNIVGQSYTTSGNDSTMIPYRKKSMDLAHANNGDATPDVTDVPKLSRELDLHDVKKIAPNRTLISPEYLMISAD